MSAIAIPVSAFGGAAGGALVWRVRGELFLTATVKIQVALVHDDVASIATATELVRADSPSGDASLPLELPTDLSPPLPKPEVVLVGHACAPGQRPVPSMSVRLFVGREDQALLDKTLHVYGDRPNGAVQPHPFVRVPLSWALAVGGPNTDNPAGRPLNDPVAPPNVVDPHSPWSSAGFAPIAASWPFRLRAARSALPQAAAGVLEVPADLQMDYFQCAPPDQRLTSLVGDEWIVVDGMHAERTRFQSQLPSLKARARLTRGGLGEAMPFALTLDRLFIDMDRLTAQLSWRGSMHVEPADLMAAQIIVGIESTDDELMELSSETMMLSEAQLNNAMDGQALPWELEPPPPARKSTGGRAFGGLPFKPPASAAPLPSPSAPRSLAPPVAVAAQPAVAPPKFGRPPIEIVNESTITSVDEHILAALPFGQFPPPVQAARARAAVSQGFDVPAALEDDDDDAGQTKVAPIPSLAERALPFGLSQASAAPASLSPEPPPAMTARPPLTTMPLLDVVQPSPPLPRRSAGPSALGEDAVRVATPLPVLFGETSADAVAAAPPEPPRPVAGPSALLGSGAGSSLAAASPLEPAPPEPVVEEMAPPDPPSAEAALKQLVLDNIRNDVKMYDMDLAGADLSDLDLRGGVFGGAKLMGAKLCGSLLRDARLANAKLSGANLRGADFTNADLGGADLSRADLTDAIFDNATLTGANLSSVQASGARFFRAAADRVQFVQARLERASLEVASVRDADFSGAMINNTTFNGANAQSAIFSEARGEGAIFDDADISNAAFGGAALPDLRCVGARASRSNWERAELDRAAFDRCDLSQATLVRASIEVASFLSAELCKADLSNVSADGADFSDANLSGADLRMSKLSDARFTNAKLMDSNGQKALAVGARMEGADLSRASFRGARMKGCQLSNANLDGTDLRDADLEGAKLDGADTSKAKLAGANMKGVEGVSS